MKRHLLILVILLGTLSSWGQTANDQSAVLQKIMTLPDLQQYYPKNADGSIKQLCIAQYPVAFPAEVVAIFDASKVVFRNGDAIKANLTDAYFMFRSFNLEPAVCTVSANYFSNFNYSTGQFNFVSYTIKLEKTADGWNITNLTKGGIR